MRKFFSTLAGMIIVIILAVLIVGYLLWSRMPDIVANDLSKKLKVNVQIDDIFLGWGKINIEKVEVGNTPGSVLSKAFSCKYINILAPLSRYMSKHLVINEIHIHDVYLGLEFDTPTSTKGNWTEIMSNASSENKSTKSKKQQSSAKEDQQTVLIHKLILTNINVDVLYRKDGGKVKHLPVIDRIELNEISSEGGVPMDQIMNSVLGQMLKSVFEKENLKNMLQEIIKQPNDLKNYLQPFKGMFNSRFLETDLYNSEESA